MYKLLLYLSIIVAAAGKTLHPALKVAIQMFVFLEKTIPTNFSASSSSKGVARFAIPRRFVEAVRRIVIVGENVRFFSLLLLLLLLFSLKYFCYAFVIIAIILILEGRVEVLRHRITENI